MTPGQIAHDAGEFERKWEHMGKTQQASWERIAQAVLKVQPAVIDAITDAIREELRGLYYCGRVWRAWNDGTMTEDDFHPAEEGYFAENIAAAIYAIAQPVQPKEKTK
jgi:lysophospholipase L1-like esterase